MIICQVSEYWKKGPVAAHTITNTIAPRNAAGLPVKFVAQLANLSKKLTFLSLLIVFTFFLFKILTSNLTRIFHNQI